MAAFLSRTALSRGDLQLLLKNDFGHPQDGFDVRWTVYKDSGEAASGRRLTAVRAGTGEYYAPWGCGVDNGCYKIIWEYRDSPGGRARTACERFYVVAPSSFQCCAPDFVCPGADPVPGCSTFLCGQVLGPGDLPLYLRDDAGVPANAFAVFWTIQTSSGCPITRRLIASPAGPAGEYYASWLVNAIGGDYVIKWEFMQDPDSPLESVCMGFSVISPPAIIMAMRGISGIFGSACCTAPAPQSGSSCCSVILLRNPSVLFPCQPQTSSSAFQIAVPVVSQSCCDVEIARVVHLPTTNLPPGGSFTDQPAYQIPNQVHKIAFYISYARGAAGGFGVFRLLWGNGTEETQSTLINLDFVQINGQSSFQETFLNDLKSPAPQTDEPINFLIETTVPGGARTVRLIAAEGGVIGAPGTVAITLTASS